jgi:hypothetical protein
MNDVARASLFGALASSLVVAGIYFGSRGLKDFDTALVSYAGASVFAAFGVAYRYAMWLARPPTRLYFRRGWQFFLAPRHVLPNVLRAIRLLIDNLFLQRFIERRSPMRWLAHAGIFWGCLLAAAVTFPLSFGWIRFETPRDSQSLYDAYVFGLHILRFPLKSSIALISFNILVISAVLVLIGVFFALWRRARDRGALAVQQYANDLLPLFLLFAISITGLLLTVSARFLHGYHYGFLSQFHAVTVIFTLLYLPFGKFFHIFQRPAQVSLEFYRRRGQETGTAACARCGQPFATKLQVEDLKQVEAELVIRFDDGPLHYQDVCPSCRRKNLALVQDALWRGERQEQ